MRWCTGRVLPQWRLQIRHSATITCSIHNSTRIRSSLQSDTSIGMRDSSLLKQRNITGNDVNLFPSYIDFNNGDWMIGSYQSFFFGYSYLGTSCSISVILLSSIWSNNFSLRVSNFCCRYWTKSSYSTSFYISIASSILECSKNASSSAVYLS